MKRNQKGFTVVEMVVAMVIIAILAAVIISACTSIIRKAHINNDISMAKNLNTALSIYAAQHDISTYHTPFDFAFEAIQDAGYSIENLTTKTSGIYFVYESETNQFMLIETEASLGAIVDHEVIYCINEEYTELPVYIEDQKLDSTWYFALEKDEQTKLEGSKTELHNANYLSVIGNLSDLKNLLSAANGKETIYLSTDLVMTDNINLDNPNADVTIVLGKSTLTNDTLTGKSRIRVNQGKLTVVGGTLDDKSGDQSAYSVCINPETVATLSGTTINSNSLVAVYCGHTYDANKRANEVEIENCSINANGYGVYAHYSNITISNVNITAAPPVVISHAAEVVIESGNFKSNSHAIAVLMNNYKSAAEANPGEVSSPPTTLKIKGGSFDWVELDNHFLFDFASSAGGKARNTKVEVSGGTFKGEDYITFFRKYTTGGALIDDLKGVNSRKTNIKVSESEIDGKVVFTIIVVDYAS